MAVPKEPRKHAGTMYSSAGYSSPLVSSPTCACLNTSITTTVVTNASA